MSDDFEGVVPDGEGGEGVVDGEGGQVNQHGEYIPKQRFDQVYGKSKEYEKQLSDWRQFGDPNDVRSRLEKLQQYEKALEDYRQKQSMTPNEQQEATRALQLQKELYKVMPSLKLLDKIEALESKISEYEGRSTEAQYSATLKDMSSQFADVLKAAKIDLKHQDKLEDYIASQMTQEQKQEFIAGNFEIAKQIFDNELKEGIFASMRTRPNLPAPPLRNTPGGTPPKSKGDKPLSMKEAEQEAWARFSGSE